MRVMILGGDGYLGWPTALYFSARNHDVAVVDNFIKRKWEMELGIEPLMPINTLYRRLGLWENLSNKKIPVFTGDLQDDTFTSEIIKKYAPDTIIHYAEQPSAPFSMMNQKRAIETQVNNVTGTINVMFAIKEFVPDCHLIKLGTMGEYGTPNIEIEEGFLEIEYKGRKDILPYPKQPGSFYHLSKVHDSNNLLFACKVWDLRVTDLNQGIVYGIETDETKLCEGLNTSFHYDEIFGTVLNRFCVQAIYGVSLTVYGKGRQVRGFLNIRDTLKCIELAALHPPAPGNFRVFNQFTEQFSILELAELVAGVAKEIGIKVKINNIPNPRLELEEHFYKANNSSLLSLGLKPTLISDELINSMLRRIARHKNSVIENKILPSVQWRCC